MTDSNLNSTTKPFINPFVGECGLGLESGMDCSTFLYHWRRKTKMKMKLDPFQFLTKCFIERTQS